jgi:hypothetical protein
MTTQAKPNSKPETETKPARDRFREQIRTGVTAGEATNRLFDSQNQNGGQNSPGNDD